VLKERVDVLAVGDGAGRRRAVDVLKAALVYARDFAPPKLLARLAVERDDEQSVIGLVLRVDRRMGGDVNACASQHGRRMARRQRGLPDDVFLGAELDRKIRRAGNARAIGSAEARPFVVICDRLTTAKQREDKRGDETHWHNCSPRYLIFFAA